MFLCERLAHATTFHQTFAFVITRVEAKQQVETQIQELVGAVREPNVCSRWFVADINKLEPRRLDNNVMQLST